MKNQYFGDVNDYRKYGMLRGLIQRDVSLLVCWMLTAEDGGSDGKFTRYLREPDRWRSYDPTLFDALYQELVERGRRRVAAAEERGILPGAVFESTLVKDDLGAREMWMAQVSALARGRDLVFFDPDNGTEVRSVPKGRRRSSKYVYWDELERAWAVGASLLVYQHFPREKRSQFLSRLARSTERVLRLRRCSRSGRRTSHFFSSCRGRRLRCSRGGPWRWGISGPDRSKSYRSENRF